MDEPLVASIVGTLNPIQQESFLPSRPDKELNVVAPSAK